MTHVVVLGAGRVGGAMARDLAPDFQVTVRIGQRRPWPAWWASAWPFARWTSPMPKP